MRISKMSRRHLLATLGGAAAVSVLDPFMPRVLAQSQATPPRRFLYLFTGTAPSSSEAAGFYPSGVGKLAFAAGSPFNVLNPLATKLCFIKGLNLDAAADGTAGGPHPKGAVAAFSGAGLRKLEAGEEEFVEGQTLGGDGYSVDQRIAESLQGVTTFRSLELGIDNAADFRGNATKSVSYAKRHVVDRIQDPKRLFDTLFASVGSGLPSSGGPDPALERVRLERRSVLDYVRSSVNSLGTRLGSEDRERMQAHLEAIRNLELRLAGAEGGTAQVCAGLEAPKTPAGGFAQENNYPAVQRAFSELSTLALSCDLTRVVGMMHGNPTDTWRYPWINVPTAGFGNYHQATHTAGATAARFVRGVWQWRAEMFAEWMQLLDDVKEEGGTLLDHCFVVWLQDAAVAHSHDSTLCITAGKGGDFFRTGQTLDAGGVPNNRLLTSICQYMGLDVETFGDAKHGKGTLSTLHA